MKFTLRGIEYETTRELVTAAMKGKKPKAIEKYAAKVGDEWFPPKQIIETCLSVGTMTYTTQDALRILNKLGFQSVEYHNNGGVTTPQVKSTVFGMILDATIGMATNEELAVLHKAVSEEMIRRMK